MRDLRESEQFHRLLTDKANDFIRLHDLAGESVYANPATERLYGGAPTSLFQYAHPDDLERCRRWWERLQAGHDELLYWRVRTVDGAWRWLETRAAIVEFRGSPHVLTVCRDVTERKHGEDAQQAHLRFLESLDRVHRAIQGATDVEQMMCRVLDAVVAIFDAEWSALIYPCAPAAERWTVAMDSVAPGVCRSGSRSEPMTDEVARLMQRVLASDTPLRFGADDAAAPAGLFPGDDESSGLLLAVRSQTDPPYLFAIGQGKSRRAWSSQEERLLQEIGRRMGDAFTVLLAVRDLRASEARLDEAQRMAHVGHWENELDADRITWSNETYRILGLQPREIPATLREFRERIHPDDRDRQRDATARAQRGEGRYAVEYRVIRPDGEVRMIRSEGDVVRDEAGKPRRAFGVMQDVTERKQLEAQVQQSQKLEAVGLLAGGIAHDFNNLLTVITAYAEMLRDDVADADSRADLEQVLGAAQRAGGLTRQLLAFSRQQVLQPRVVNANEAVTSVVTMLRRVIGEDITMRTELHPQPWHMFADPGQLEQVLMNLAVNGRDAMPRGGTLSLCTSNADVTDAAARARPGLVPGQYVLLEVEDTGTGIEPAVLARLFEPFFTTKPPGRGTGLGLATVYGIVKQSGGFIYVDSVPGEGSRFSVYLPRYTGEVVRESAPVTATVRGTGTILLVEDDSAVRVAVRRMLEKAGYNVLVAQDGAEALRQVTTMDVRGQRIDLVLTDIVMPEQGGRVLGERLTAHWPDIRVMYMSGYTDDEILRRGLIVPGAAFLEKPFTPQRLLEAVAHELRQSAPDGPPDPTAAEAAGAYERAD